MNDNNFAVFAGQSTIDTQYLLSEYIPRDGKVSAKKFSFQPGGQALNASIAFSALGGRAKLVTPIGDDPFKPVILKDLSTYGIELFDICNAKPSTLPVSAIISNDVTGSRSIITSPCFFSYSEDIDLSFDGIYQSNMYLVDSNYPNFACKFIDKIENKDRVVVFDAEIWTDKTYELIKHIDIAICSEDFSPGKTMKTSEVVDFLAVHGVRKIAITRGGNSIVYFDDGVMGEIKVPEVDVLDTLAAGDFFHGAFCYYYIKSKNFINSLKHASELASFSCRFFGAREWISHLR